MGDIVLNVNISTTSPYEYSNAAAGRWTPHSSPSSPIRYVREDGTGRSISASCLVSQPTADTINTVIDNNLRKGRIPNARTVSESDVASFVVTKIDEDYTSHLPETAHVFRAFQLEEQANIMISQSRFLEASALLDERVTLTPTESQVISRLKILLMNVECDLQLSRECDAAREEINEVIMTSARPMIGDVMSLIDSYVRNTSHTRAIILLQCVSKIHGMSSMQSAVEGIGQCLDKTLETLKPMMKSGERMKAIAAELVVPFMREMYDQIFAIEHRSPEARALVLAESLLRLSSAYFLLEDFHGMARACRQGIEILDRRFGSKASDYKIHGWLLLSLGTTSDRLGSTSTAINCLEQTIQTFERAKDVATEKEKCENIAKAKSILQRLMKRKSTN